MPHTEEPYSVSQLASYLGVSGNTIRNWGDEFADFLSAGAQPPKGAPREYTEEDAAIFETAAVLRAQHVDYEDIRERLAEGERLEFQEPPGEAQKQGETGEPSTALVTQLTATVARYEGELGAVREERDHLRQKVDEAEAARRQAENRAAVAEERAAMLREQLEAQKPTDGETVATEGQGETDEGRPWWAFWRS